MLLRLLPLVLFVASACGGAAATEPTRPPATDPLAGLSVPPGPVVYEPEQLIMPPEEFLLKAEVARDAPIAIHGWERQFATPSSPDFRWFTIRLYVLEPDIPPSRFVEENGCGAVVWPEEEPATFEAPTGTAESRACRYEFGDGARVLYYTSGFRNVGLLVGAQPRRDEVTDRIAVEWLAALARNQVAIIGKVLAR